MKKNSLSLVIFLLLVSFSSCRKEAKGTEQVSQEQKFLKLLEPKLALLANAENDALIFTKNGDKYEIDFQKSFLSMYFDSVEPINSKARIGGCSKAVGKEVCSGGGVSFARCSQGYLDGGCALTVWKGKDGNYQAKIAQL
jgi:hypothetical protein